MRVLGIDYGEKRVGIAWSDMLGLTAQSQPYLLNSPSLFADIKTIILEQNVTEIVVGLPIKMDGNDSLTTQKTREFSSMLKDMTSLPIHLQDERLSSQAVEKHLIAMDVSRKNRKNKIDSQAAAFVLQGFLDRRNLTSSSGSSLVS